MKKNTPQQREAYLIKAVAMFTKAWAKVGVTVPVDVQVSCGFPGGGSVMKRAGECWPRSRSAAGVNQIFVNPTQSRTVGVLGILGHELLHAVDDCKSGHGRVFNMNSRLVGYSGGKRSLPTTPEANALITAIVKKHGEYPHGALNATKAKQKKSDGLQKCECEDCGDVLYSTMKKLELYGAPVCRDCGEGMQVLERGKQKTVTTL